MRLIHITYWVILNRPATPSVEVFWPFFRKNACVCGRYPLKKHLRGRCGSCGTADLCNPFSTQATSAWQFMQTNICSYNWLPKRFV